MCESEALRFKSGECLKRKTTLKEFEKSRPTFLNFARGDSPNKWVILIKIGKNENFQSHFSLIFERSKKYEQLKFIIKFNKKDNDFCTKILYSNFLQ